MKKVTLPSFFLVAIAKAFILFFLLGSLYAQDDTAANQWGDPVAGKALFNSQCAACHALDRNMTGPALRGVGDKYEMEWLYKWVRNSSEFIRSGDERANKIYAEWNNSVMQAFPQLSDVDINNIIAYTMEPKSAPVVEVAADAAVGGGASNDGGITNQIVLLALVMVMVILLFLLYLVKNVLDKIAVAQGIEVQENKIKINPAGVWHAFVKNQFLVFVSVVFLLLSSAYFAYGWMMQIGVDQGYEPIQPIHYSHRIHAGENQIECQYCHSSAKESKHSGIPSLNVCMNCHMNIAEVAEDTYKQGMDEYGIDYNKEIEKLYAAVGWDPSTRVYTGNTNPVKWVRIHNLPDLVYFNHAQHVTVGQIECQTCHGPVEEMEILYQHSPLTMGWCINCHRETEVQLKNNEYYTKIHDQLAKQKGVERLTAADLGGLECGKCHY